MLRKNSALSIYFLYLVVGGVATLLAFYLATALTPKSRSQDKPSVKKVDTVEHIKVDEALIQQIAEDPGILLKSLRTYDYDPKGKRDPFQPYYGDIDFSPGDRIGPMMYLQRFDLDQLKLIGVIWNVTRPRAMIQDPTGSVHTVQTNAKIGRNYGYIAAIREGEIVIVEPFDDGGKMSYTTRIMTIGRSE